VGTHKGSSNEEEAPRKGKRGGGILTRRKEKGIHKGNGRVDEVCSCVGLTLGRGQPLKERSRCLEIGVEADDDTKREGKKFGSSGPETRRLIN